jgi:nickel-dependent lactate racemase
MSVIGRGEVGKTLTVDQIREIVAGAAKQLNAAGQRVLAIVPDGTRTCPLPLILREVHAAIGRQASKFDVLIALGTHPPMSEPQIDKLLGVEPGRRGQVFPGMAVYNHAWDQPSQLRQIGTLTKDQVSQITDGLFAMDIGVSINKLVFDYDVVLVCGPVFPHEVVGFSGGAKYFFPGICGEELLHFFHWLGAVITNARIIGHKDTPVRATLEAAAKLIGVDKHALSMVVSGHDLAGLYFGDVHDSWSKAVELSDKLHITYVDKPFTSVLSQAPAMYDELWVGGKCMYKLEPVVADGGELIIYAPHMKDVSITHGRYMLELGYHCRDYYLKQWDRFKHYPWGTLAHSTHVSGVGTFEGGVEKRRIQVTLATGIPEKVCKQINLGYRDPAGINIDEWRGREADGRLYIPKAGEMLYRLKNSPAWATL